MNTFTAPAAAGQAEHTRAPWKDDDREWFAARPDRSHRLRALFPDEPLDGRDISHPTITTKCKCSSGSSRPAKGYGSRSYGTQSARSQILARVARTVRHRDGPGQATPRQHQRGSRTRATIQLRWSATMTNQIDLLEPDRGQLERFVGAFSDMPIGKVFSVCGPFLTAKPKQNRSAFRACR